jgi:hypothetical protein
MKYYLKWYDPDLDWLFQCEHEGETPPDTTYCWAQMPFADLSGANLEIKPMNAQSWILEKRT